jgi:outer membrane biosynthesis protein TonB
MLFEKDEDLELQPKRTKTLLISIGIHVLLLVIFVLNPDLLTGPPKRIIRIMGQDYDLSKEQVTELVMPPNSLNPKPAAPPDKPLVQPPAPQPENPPPPPPPPPQQPQQQQPPPPPPKVIGPDDILKEGARPDAQPKASRGDTTEQARAGAQEQQPKPEPPKSQQQRGQNSPPPLFQNTNPNALRAPNLLDSAGKIVQADTDAERRRYSQVGPRTGTPNGQEDPNFSTEEPTILSDTKGYDFGPYMNQVINRVRSNWFSIMPEIARLGKKGRVVIIFTITADGGIEGEHIAANSGTEPLDRASFSSISLSNPFGKLPAGFSGDHLDLQFTFLYNIR